MDIACDLGVWLDSAVRNTPHGTLSWAGLPRRVHTAAVGRCVIATLRYNAIARQWSVSIPGFLWDVSGDKGSGTQRDLNIKQSPVRAFKTSKQARRAVEQAYAALLGCATAPSS